MKYKSPKCQINMNRLINIFRSVIHNVNLCSFINSLNFVFNFILKLMPNYIVFVI